MHETRVLSQADLRGSKQGVRWRAPGAKVDIFELSTVVAAVTAASRVRVRCTPARPLLGLMMNIRLQGLTSSGHASK